MYENIQFLSQREKDLFEQKFAVPKTRSQEIYSSMLRNKNKKIKWILEVRDFMNPFDINSPGVRKEHQVVMRAGGEKVLDKITRILFRGGLARLHANHALSAAALGTIGTDICALDEAVVGECDDHRLVSNEILDGHFTFVWRQLGAARRGILLSDGGQLILDDGEHARLFRQDVQQVLDFDN